MILRPAVADDANTFEDFDLGDTSAPHLAEVAEIVRELWLWSQGPSVRELDRQVHSDHGCRAPRRGNSVTPSVRWP